MRDPWDRTVLRLDGGGGEYTKCTKLSAHTQISVHALLYHVNFLDVTLHSSYIRCYHWGKSG